MAPPSPLEHQRAACARDLARLQRLEERHRLRAVVTRGARGGVGFAAGLGMAVKMKIAATLGGKLLIAALIGIGFAWPIVIMWVVGIGLVAFVIAAIFEGEFCNAADLMVCDCADCADCNRKNKRRQRVMDMIAEREKWLAHGFGPPPGRRGSAVRPA
jgi:hypothetical protein